MEFLILILLLAVVIFFFMYKKNPVDSTDSDEIEATYICDECGENECICRKEEDRKQ